MRQAYIIAAVLLSASTAAAADVKESFTAGGNPTHGATVGSCQQLVVSLSGAGAIALGSGATVQTGAEGDAAFLASAAPLPNGDYKVVVEIANINYPMPAGEGKENGATLLAITDVPPQASSESWWSSHRIVGFEADMPAGATQQNTIYVNYWNGSNMSTWSSGQWAAGDPGWKPAATYDGSGVYSFSVEKAGGNYTLVMSQGGTELVRASVPVASTTATATEYLVVGDRLTDAFNGSMTVVSITMPATCGGPNPTADGGVKKSDGGNIDPPPGLYDWGGPGNLDMGKGKKATGRPQTSSCDCTLGGGSDEKWSLALLLGLLLLLRRRR
jgi:MYXO-CTERM domain-containing protein